MQNGMIVLPLKSAALKNESTGGANKNEPVKDPIKCIKVTDINTWYKCRTNALSILSPNLFYRRVIRERIGLLWLKSVTVGNQRNILQAFL